MELKMSSSITAMQYANRFKEVSKFVHESVSSKRLKMRRFERGLAFSICNQLASQPILTYQELYMRTAEVERVNIGLRALNPINQKRKLAKQALSESVNQKKSAPTFPKSHPIGLIEPCGKCGRTNNTTPE